VPQDRNCCTTQWTHFDQHTESGRIRFTLARQTPGQKAHPPPPWKRELNSNIGTPMKQTELEELLRDITLSAIVKNAGGEDDTSTVLFEIDAAVNQCCCMEKIIRFIVIASMFFCFILTINILCSIARSFY
jgi:hypothetical protein